MNKTLFVTGTGIITGLGYGRQAQMEALRRKQSAVGKVRYLQTEHTELPVSQVPFSNEEMMDYLEIPRKTVMTRTVLLGRMALKEALEESGINPREQRTVFVSGTTVGGMDKSEQFYLDFLNNDKKNAYIKTHDCGTCSEMIAGYCGGFDKMTTLSTACSSAANALLIGMEMIQTGHADVAVVGGSECITRFHLNGFNTLMILDKEICRPFDKTRAGLNLGEGAGYLVLESEESLIRRKAKALCRFSGCANRCDAFHQTASSPDGEGAYLAMKAALENAGLQASDIDYINAHGTGTLHNDLSEGKAIMRLFGDKIPPTASVKGYIGHTTSAAGGVEGVLSVLALNGNYMPVNLNFHEKIDELSFSPSIEEYPSKPLKHILSNSFGFGGNDTVCIFSRAEEAAYLF